MKAYHFVGVALRDGRPVPPDGETLIHEGPLELCARGLHAGADPLDALKYAPGATLCLVECGGEIIHDNDKLVCTERTIIQRVDATEMLRAFARWCALEVIDLWTAPDVVQRYLDTGDPSIRQSACSAAKSAGWTAVRDARSARVASAASCAAARDAAWSAMWSAWPERDASTVVQAMWTAGRDARIAARSAARDAEPAQRAEFNRRVGDLFSTQL